MAFSLNLQCTATEDTSELQAEINPLVHFNATWHKNQLDLSLPWDPKIANDVGELFIPSMHKQVNKYADVFTKLGKPVVQNIKHKIELFDAEKPLPNHRL